MYNVRYKAAEVSIWNLRDDYS